MTSLVEDLLLLARLDSVDHWSAGRPSWSSSRSSGSPAGTLRGIARAALVSAWRWWTPSSALMAAEWPLESAPGDTRITVHLG